MALWIDNDQGSYHYSREMAETARHEASIDNGVWSRTAEGLLADGLKEWQEDEREQWARDDAPASVFNDLLSAAISEIDWYEIAENYLGEIERSE